MVSGLIQLAGLLGITAPFLIFIIVVAAWDGVWKLIALWKAARKGSVAWFIILAIINSAGILPILYIFLFSEMRLKKAPVPARKTRRRR